MDYKSFGQLLKTLLKEYPSQNLDDPDLVDRKGISQAEFARKCGLDKTHPDAVFRICQGDQKLGISPKVLEIIADHLPLTQMERKEFFEIANGIPMAKIFSREETAPLTEQEKTEREQNELNKVFDLIRQSCLPTIVADQFLDVLAVNEPLANLYGLKDEARTRATMADPTGYNLINYILNPLHGFFEMIGSTKLGHEVLVSNMQLWRRSILPYRAETYVKDLKHALATHKDRELKGRFKNYWDYAFEERDLDGNFERVYNFYHPGLNKRLKYAALLTPEMTGSGELYVVTYIPSNLETFDIFGGLVDHDYLKTTGKIRIMELAPWPLRKKWSIRAARNDKTWSAPRPRWS